MDGSSEISESSPRVPPECLLDFEQAKKAFMAQLSREEQDEVHLTTASSVLDHMKRLQIEQERRGLQRGLKKIKPFIDGLQKYSTTIEQFVTINPGILAAIWGPVKLLLQISSNVAKCFDSILNALRDIGYCLPRFDMFSRVFQRDTRVSEVLVWLYTDLLEFYREVLKLFRKPGQSFMSYYTFSALTLVLLSDNFNYL